MIRLIRFSWLTILNVGFLFIVLLICFALLSQTDQGNDFMDAMVQDSFLTNWWQNIIFFVLLFGWCYMCWYGASLTLQVDPYTGNFDLDTANPNSDLEIFKRYSRNISYFMGTLPALLILLTFLITDVPGDKMAHFKKELPFLALTILIIYVSVKLFISRDRSMNEGDWPVNPVINHRGDNGCKTYSSAKWRNFKYLADGLCYIKTYRYIRYYFKWVGLIAIVLLTLFCFRDINISITKFIGPASTALLCFMFLTFIFTIFYYFQDIQSFPFALIIIAFALVFSFWNDNTEPDRMEAQNRDSINEAFKKWVANNVAGDTSAEIPVYFIAAQGGGIRGMKWTAIVLDSLNKKTNGNFIKHTFCMSGVSGGGVGEVMYLAYLKDGQKNGKAFNSFLSGDYLSPVLASYAFPEMLQKIIPAKVRYFERAKTLGYAWADGYQGFIGEPTLHENFLDLWYNQGSLNTNIPSAFINGTLAETGQRIITSNLVLAKSKDHEYIDFYDGFDGGISANAAALNCCRFSGITPGELYIKNKKAMGHIIDGGFRENTGIGTLLNVLNEIQGELKGTKIKPYIIYIKNGKNSKEEKPNAMTIGHDLGTAFKGLLNSLGTGKSENLLTEIVRCHANQTGAFKFVELYIDSCRVDTNVTLPLGWYLSRSASNEIDNCLVELFKNNSFCIHIK